MFRTLYHSMPPVVRIATTASTLGSTIHRSVGLPASLLFTVRRFSGGEESASIGYDGYSVCRDDIEEFDRRGIGITFGWDSKEIRLARNRLQNHINGETDDPESLQSIVDLYSTRMTSSARREFMPFMIDRLFPIIGRFTTSSDSNTTEAWITLMSNQNRHGLRFLLDLRSTLLQISKSGKITKELSQFGSDLSNIFLKTVFNPKNLLLHRVSWVSPTVLIDQIIQMERVHPYLLSTFPGDAVTASIGGSPSSSDTGLGDQVHPNSLFTRTSASEDLRDQSRLPTIRSIESVYAEHHSFGTDDGSGESAGSQSAVQSVPISSGASPMGPAIDSSVGKQMWTSSNAAITTLSGGLDLIRDRLHRGRRCFAYLHPDLGPSVPLVFVHVACMGSITSSIHDIIHSDRRKEREQIWQLGGPKTAIFYSINSTEPGLQGIDLACSLIKDAAHATNTEFPSIQTFSTLSPIPGFMNWIQQYLPKDTQAMTKIFSESERYDISRVYSQLASRNPLMPHLHKSFDQFVSILNNYSWVRSRDVREIFQPILTKLCVQYLLEEKRRTQNPNAVPSALDPVCNFHVQNGAQIEQINWLGNLTEKGLAESAGMMVNYRYILENCNGNSQKYKTTGTIPHSPEVGNMQKRLKSP